MCILFLSKPPVYEYSAWKRLFLECVCFKRKISEKIFDSVRIDRIFQRASSGGKVYKYPVHKVERDSSKFWFCGVQTV